ncbi:Uncharacterised protein [Yersinia frederiksenii]|uniref:Uncharacterized protein n=1 Tax=Yersinia intermedia TaxID=631 RepID=A0A0T9MU35_YERIN|nr:Uncharacterised protein [Yersinia intermedia]CNI75240.1 Uncharacterised protein [Yersinia frederiksenii]
MDDCTKNIFLFVSPHVLDIITRAVVLIFKPREDFIFDSSCEKIKRFY